MQDYLGLKGQSDPIQPDPLPQLGSCIRNGCARSRIRRTRSSSDSRRQLRGIRSIRGGWWLRWMTGLERCWFRMSSCSSPGLVAGARWFEFCNRLCTNLHLDLYTSLVQVIGAQNGLDKTVNHNV
jgi:hypothetical protein